MAGTRSTLSPRQRHALAALGVDVWIRRAVDSKAAPQKTATPMAQTSPATPVAKRAPPDAPAAQPRIDLRIQLDCIAAPGIVIVGGFGNPLDRRIAQDIVQAIAGVSAQMQHTQFRWPQTQTGDASVTAAANAYGEFLRGQVERAQALRLLLFGATAASLLDARTGVGDATILQLPEAHALRADPAAKKRLWLSVSQTVQT